jgi:hypothetical protein
VTAILDAIDQALTAPVPSDLDMQRLVAKDAAALARVWRSCGCHGDHEERWEPVWERHDASDGFFTSSPLWACHWEPWLAEEDAWLADRAAREAATR